MTRPWRPCQAALYDRASPPILRPCFWHVSFFISKINVMTHCLFNTTSHRAFLRHSTFSPPKLFHAFGLPTTQLHHPRSFDQSSLKQIVVQVWKTFYLRRRAFTSDHITLPRRNFLTLFTETWHSVWTDINAANHIPFGIIMQTNYSKNVCINCIPLQAADEAIATWKQNWFTHKINFRL